jgi:aminocarboxymuconate-semialdehyde decarboxylase
MIIDAHAHLVPQSLLADILNRQNAFPSVAIDLSAANAIAFCLCGKPATRPVAPFLSDVPRRLSWMQDNGIDYQVVGGWLDMFGYELPAEEGERWARMINGHFVDLVADHSQFLPLATVPLQDGKRAANVLQDALRDGFRGIMIGTQPDAAGGVLDTPDLDPFWAAADDAGAVIYIHPVYDCGDDRVHAFGMANAVGRITDTLIAISRLVFSGHVARYPNARLVAVTGGAALPYVLGRLQKNAQIQNDLGDPDQALKRLFYDTIVHDSRSLRFLAEVVGADRIMMGSDSPFPIGDAAPLDIVAAAGFSEREAASINGELARRLFGIAGASATASTL